MNLRACIIILVVNSEVGAELLKLAMLVSDARKTFFLVCGEYELKIELSVLTDFFCVCEYFHSFVYSCNAGGHKASCALDLNKAETASADLVDALEIAKRGNVYMCRTGSFEDSRACGNGNGYTVDLYIYYVFHLSRSSFLTVYK